MKTNARTQKINSEIMKELMSIIRNDIKDPKITESMTSVTRVETTTDLKICKVYISVMGTKWKKEDVIKGLKSASGFIRKEIARKVNLRNTPEFHFLIDDSLDYAMHMDELFKKI